MYVLKDVDIEVEVDLSINEIFRGLSGSEKEVISLRLDSRMLEEINSWAIEIDISRNEFINQFLQEFLLISIFFQPCNHIQNNLLIRCAIIGLYCIRNYIICNLY